MDQVDHDLADRMARHFEDKYEAASIALKEIASACNVSDLLACLAFHLLFAPADEVVERSAGPVGLQLELAAFHTRSSNSVDQKPPPSVEQVGEALEVLEELTSAYGMVANKERSQVSDPNEHKLLRPLDFAIAQTRTVRSSAYPEQWARIIEGVLEPYADWFRTNVGITPMRAYAIIWACIKRAEKEHNELTDQAGELSEAARAEYLKLKGGLTSKERSTNAFFRRFQRTSHFGVFAFFEFLYSKAWLCISSDREELGPYLESNATDSEWVGLIDLIGLTQTRLTGMNDPVEVRPFPLLLLDRSRIIVTDLGHAMEQLYAAFEARIENSAERDRFIQHRGNWLEGETKRLLSQVFRVESLYQSLRYPDPTSNDGLEAELDIAVHVPPFVILVECKSNRFKLPTDRRDANKVKDSLQRIVDDAYKQARRALKFLEQNDVAVFREKGTGRQLSLQLSQLRRTYLMSVSLQSLASFTSQLSRLSYFNLSAMDRYPLALSLPILELIARAALLPAVVLHYLERRQVIHALQTDMIADELDFFGCYLQTRLQDKRLWGSGQRPPDLMMLDGSYTQQFDRFVYGERGDLPSVPLPGIELPKAILLLLQHLHERKTPEGLAIAFALLDMSDSSIADLRSGLEQIPAKTPPPGKVFSFTAKSDDTVTAISVANGSSPEQLVGILDMRARVEKYRLHAQKVIGFGIDVQSHRPFEHALFVEFPWELNPAMDAAMEKHPAILHKLRRGAKVPGRNDPCVCGSGKKFKKCCIDKLVG